MTDEPLGHAFTAGLSTCPSGLDPNWQCHAVVDGVECGQPRDRHKAALPIPQIGDSQNRATEKAWERAVSKPPDSDEEAARAWLRANFPRGFQSFQGWYHDASHTVASLAALLRERAAQHSKDRCDADTCACFRGGLDACLTIRCSKHYAVPQQNSMKPSGSECGGCIVERAEAAEARVKELEASAISHFQREHLEGDGPEIDRWRAKLAALEAERDQYKNAYGNAVDHRAAIAAESEAQRKRIEELESALRLGGEMGTLAAKLSVMVLGAYQRDDEAAMRAFGSNASAHVASGLAGALFRFKQPYQAALSDKGEAERG